MQTGLAKGKKNIMNPVSLPYLRVANVQDGFLDLDKIKKIQVEDNMVERYLLRNGDILFTEGGDFDKLGRGTIWRDEIPKCLHQNHVFAVRCDTKKLLSYFLASIASSPHAATAHRRDPRNCMRWPRKELLAFTGMKDF